MLALKRSLIRPLHPERVCWGCERLCPADALACGNGTERTMHPLELFGDDWLAMAEANGASWDLPADASGAPPRAAPVSPQGASPDGDGAAEEPEEAREP